MECPNCGPLEYGEHYAVKETVFCALCGTQFVDYETWLSYMSRIVDSSIRDDNDGNENSL